jgi:hypothetical protein
MTQFTDLLIQVGSMLLAFGLGGYAIWQFGGGLAQNYFLVRPKRFKKILILYKGNFGWQTFRGTKDDEGIVHWKRNKKVCKTQTKPDNVYRLGAVDVVFIDPSNPTIPIKFDKGTRIPEFDPEVYENILTRMATAPQVEGLELLKKLLIGAVLLAGLCLVLVVVLHFRITAIHEAVVSLNQIGGVI